MAFNNNKGELEFPYDIVDVDPEINSELLEDFTGECMHSIVHFDFTRYPKKKNFQRRKNWIRSGWTEEIFFSS